MKIYFEALWLAFTRMIYPHGWIYICLALLCVIDPDRFLGYLSAAFVMTGFTYLFALDDLRMFADMQNEETR